MSSHGIAGAGAISPGAIWRRTFLLTAVAVALVLASGTARRPVSGQAAITEFPVAGSASAWGITAGPDGALWFTNQTVQGVTHRITTSGMPTEIVIPINRPSRGIIAGPDGALWVVDTPANVSDCELIIGRVTITGAFTQFDTGDCNGLEITVGADGNLWFTEPVAIGRITTSGVITRFALPGGADAWGIAAGADGALWFTESQAGRIGRITTAGVVTEFPLPAAGSQPFHIVAGPDGALWFTEFATDRIGRITTAGVITEFPLLTGGGPFGIAAGPDGALWFTEINGNRIGRITTAGTISEFPLPIANSAPYAITTGPDGALWFTESRASRIGRLVPQAGSVSGAGVSCTAATIPLGGTATCTLTLSAPAGGAALTFPSPLVLSFAPGNGQTGMAGYGQVLILDGQSTVTGPGVTGVSIGNVLGQVQTVTATCAIGACVVPPGQSITFTVALRGAVGGPINVSLGSVLIATLDADAEDTER